MRIEFWVLVGLTRRPRKVEAGLLEDVLITSNYISDINIKL